MVKTVLSSAIRGISGTSVSVETDVSAGLPSFSIVGLGDAAVQESRERVRAAIRNSGFSFPAKRVTVNLAPAELRKTGPAFDLAVALSVVAEECGLGERHFEGVAVLGELALDGSVRSVGGIVAHAVSLRERGIFRVLTGKSDAKEAARVSGIEAFGADDLREAVRILRERFPEKDRQSPPEPPSGKRTETLRDVPDFKEIAGQSAAKRVLEIAAAGGHNVLLEGAPGSGKTLLCRAFAGILPPVRDEEILEIARIRSVSGIFGESAFETARPFRKIHSWASVASLLGGWPLAKPGEISLAHLWALFLDELREFPPYLLDALRQPLEDGEIRVSRALGSFSYPARFQLVGATNPCPCGYFGDREKPCTCVPGALERYRTKISGPVLDRIDLFANVPRLSASEIAAKRTGISSAEIRERVERARAIQAKRFGTPAKTNAAMSVSDLEACGFEDGARRLSLEAVDRLALSGRAHDRVRKVARTIADLAESETVREEHVAEALGYRQR